MNGKCLAAKRFIGTGEALRPLVGQVLVARMALYISPMSPKAGLNHQGSRSHAPGGNAFRDAPRHTVLRLSEIQARLELPFRPSATYFDGAEVGKSLRSCFRPDFVGFLRPVTDPGGAATGHPWPKVCKKRHERRQDKAKTGENGRGRDRL